jgi:hypothetical protein
MTSRKTAADDEGWRKGRGAYSKEVKLNRGSFPNSVPGTSPKGPGGKYTSDEQVTTRVTHEDRIFATPERRTNEAAKDIYDDICRNTSTTTPAAAVPARSNTALTDAAIQKTTTAALGGVPSEEPRPTFRGKLCRNLAASR